MKTLTVAALQLPTLGMNATRLEFYLKNAHERGVRILLMGEYVTNHFFKEMERMPRRMVKEQTRQHMDMLRKFARQYRMTFIVPIIRFRKKRPYKAIARIAPDCIEYYYQQILIPYAHWNERDFFANPLAPLAKPMIFKQDGFTIAVMGGFELHFDPLWEAVRHHRVDLVLLPTASTFGSSQRWQKLIQSRAFVCGIYLLRANRLGEYVDRDVAWRFYGDSLLVNPDGEVEMLLEDKESMLIETLEKSAVKEHRKSWQFDRILARHAMPAKSP